MDEDEGLEPRNTVDILLDNQTQRLEDIANNAVDFIRINLFILGAFVPFLATVITDIVTPQMFIESRFSRYVVGTWLVSTVIATFVYRIARSKSMSHFDTLEQAVIDGWRNVDLRDEMIENNDGYEQLTDWLMIGMTVSIAFSLMTVLFLGLGIADIIFEFPEGKENMYLIGIVTVSVITGVGANLASQTLEILIIFFSKSQSLASLVGSRLQGISSVSIHLPLFKIRISNKESLDSHVHNDYVTEILMREGLSPIRIRLLRAIREAVGLEAWTFEELSRKVEEESPDVGITRGMIHRLNEDGYVAKVSSNEQSTFILHERKGQVINSENLDKEVGGEIGRLIGHIRDDEVVRGIVAEELGVAPQEVEDVIVQGSTADRIEKLNSSVESLRKSINPDELEELDCGKIQFRNAPVRYRLTPDAIGPFALADLKRGQRAFAEGNLIKASVLASQGLELYLRSVYLRDKQTDEEGVLRMGIGQILNSLKQENIITDEEKELLDHIREIRNRAVHSEGVELEKQEVKRLLRISEEFIKPGVID